MNLDGLMCLAYKEEGHACKPCPNKLTMFIIRIKSYLF